MILFFDTETTGIRKNGFIPRVVQIGALMTNDEGKTLHELNVLMYPKGIVMSPQAAAVHGFTIELLEKVGINRDIALASFFELASLADTIVAHNIDYDLDMMNIEIDNQYNEFTKDAWRKVLNETNQFCTMAQSRDILQLPLSAAQASFFRDTGNDQKYKNPRLVEAYNHFFQKDFEGAHDAMADVRACRDVYFKLRGDK